MRAEQEIIDSWDMSEVIVTICCTAYNQEKYIAKTIESFLMQQTSFPYEIIISDDCSTDKTTEIIRSYVKKYPKIIKHIYHDKNMYSKGVIPIRDYILPLVKSKYIALCEGDDFWIDTHKLQKQVALLESQPFLSGVGHKTELMKDDELTNEFMPNFKCDKQKIEFEDFIDFNHYMHTSSLIYRYDTSNKAAIDKYLNKYPCIDFNDTFMLLVFAKFGSIGYIDQVMSVYRINDAGLWMGLDKQKQSMIFLRSCISFMNIFEKKYAKNFLEHFIASICQYSEEDISNMVLNLLKDFDKSSCENIINELLFLIKKDRENIETMASLLRANASLIDEQKKYIDQLEEIKLKFENNKWYLMRQKIIFLIKRIFGKSYS